MDFAALLALLSKIPVTVMTLLTGINWSSVFAVLWKYWYLVIITLLLLSNTLLYHELQATSEALTKEKALHVQDIKDFKTAEAIANANAKAQQAALEKESKADAKQADANYADLLTKYHASLLRFSTHQGDPSQAGNHQLPTTQGGNGPSTSTELPATITIKTDDAEICAINTARLEAVRDWALALPKEVTP